MIAAIQDLSKEPNQKSAKPVADFLEACHLIFEKGLLSKRRVNSLNSPVLHNIKKGMAFFEKWCCKHEETGIAFVLSNISSKQQMFPTEFQLLICRLLSSGV